MPKFNNATSSSKREKEEELQYYRDAHKAEVLRTSGGRMPGLPSGQFGDDTVISTEKPNYRPRIADQVFGVDAKNIDCGCCAGGFFLEQGSGALPVDVQLRQHRARVAWENR
jgi:hypothetical protein